MSIMDHLKDGQLWKFKEESVKVQYVFSSIAAGHGYKVACSLYKYSDMFYTYYIKEHCTELNCSDTGL